MRVWAIWFGGSGYGLGHIDRDLEEFASIAEAVREFERRRYGIGGCQFNYVNREPEFTSCPAVDEFSEIHLYFRNPTDEVDPYPDRRLFFGPRGGVNSEPC